MNDFSTTEPYFDLANSQPIVMRWIETVSGGSRKWYLAALRSDATYWGYVHIRTDSLSENRTFNGQLDVATYTHILSLVNSVEDDISVSDLNQNCDGLIGLGSLGDLMTIIKYRFDSSDLPSAQIFQTIVGLLQSKLIIAAQL